MPLFIQWIRRQGNTPVTQTYRRTTSPASHSVPRSLLEGRQPLSDGSPPTHGNKYTKSGSCDVCFPDEISCHQRIRLCLFPVTECLTARQTSRTNGQTVREGKRHICPNPRPRSLALTLGNICSCIRTYNWMRQSFPSLIPLMIRG